MKSRIFVGRTRHWRRLQSLHAFTYRMFWLSIDLDELPLLDRGIRGFRHNRRAAATICDRDYGGHGEGSIKEKVGAILGHAGIAPPHHITLLTVPRVLGYVFNPVSFYLVRRPDGSLISLVAEVRNTFGESHHYIMTPDSREVGSDDVASFTFAKRFYVSPFLDRSGDYHVRMRARDDRFEMDIELCHEGRIIFTAQMFGDGQVLSNATFWRTLARYPLYAATVMAKIHWQAFLLHFRRRARVHAKPELLPGESMTARAPSFWHRLRAAIVARAAQRANQGARPKARSVAARGDFS